jgi:hypothetical protein
MNNNYKFDIEILENKISLLKLNKKDYDFISFLITKEILFKNTFSFISLTFTKHEPDISIFVDYSIAEYIIKYVSANNLDTYSKDDNYIAIRIYDTHDGIDHIGIVSHISSIFAKCQIPILYINNYDNNYILIKEKYLDDAKIQLKNCGGLFNDL